MAVDYEFVYELMRAYPNSNLLVNKRVVGGKVEAFLDIPNSYKQTIFDEDGNPTFWQYIEFSLPFHLKFFPLSFFRLTTGLYEKPLTKFFQKIEREIFKGKLLPVSDNEIERYNRYWGVEVYMPKECTLKSCGVVETPSGKEVVITTLRTGKAVPDVYEVVLKPLGYFE